MSKTIPPSSDNKPSWGQTFLFLFFLACISAAIWFGGPFTTIIELYDPMVRIGLIGAVIFVLSMVSFIRNRLRRRAARALESAMVVDHVEDDGDVLKGRMEEALAKLKKQGGPTYLYDLPWYVIIGPPGAGKTTAIANSGIEFPLSDGSATSLTGFGGTRYCDWWFAEDAILIDTAGRYTTQDSNAASDKASWLAFLDLLKASRPASPINGVILAFSVEDMMQGNEDLMAHHAETVRTRLAEVHQTLKVSFPVYVMFTKSDLILGFREYFASFDQTRRKAVWGTTFQTKDKETPTWERIPEEFDRMVARLSDEMIDRLNMEPDGVARIAMFGLPGQMMLMRDNIANFLTKVFQPTRYKTTAFLRGFYFTSGTQEGTPFDQVIGAMRRLGQTSDMSRSFLSGKGKSYFIHDLLDTVIFTERDWVSYDRKAVRRRSVFRGFAMTVMSLATLGVLGLFGYSYWINASVTQLAGAEIRTYASSAREEIARDLIGEARLEQIVPFLSYVRDLPAGYADDFTPEVWEDLGLDQTARLKAAGTQSYSDALEKMLRPRLVFALEQKLPPFNRTTSGDELFEALKAYLVVGRQGGRNEDSAILAYFEKDWAERYPGEATKPLRDDLMLHLKAMLDLDGNRGLLVDIHEPAVTAARAVLNERPLLDQARDMLLTGSDVADWTVAGNLGPKAAEVFADSDTIRVPGVFTYDGFWGHVYPRHKDIVNRLEANLWVLGDAAEFDEQLVGLDEALDARYQSEFEAAWQAALSALQLPPLADSGPKFTFARTLVGQDSPLLDLVNEVALQTRLTRDYDGLKGLDPNTLPDVVSQKVQGRLGALNDTPASVTAAVLQVGTSWNIEAIETTFTDWIDLASAPGDLTRAMAGLGEVVTVLSDRTGADASALPDGLPATVRFLEQTEPGLPGPLADMFAGLAEDARSLFTSGGLETLNAQYGLEVGAICAAQLDDRTPESILAIVGSDGAMTRFVQTALAGHVISSEEGLLPNADSPIGPWIAPATLAAFSEGASLGAALSGNAAVEADRLAGFACPARLE